MKIAFVHPALMDYRFELFNKLNESFDMTFIFTHQGIGQGNVKVKHLRIPPQWEYKIIRNNTFIVKGREILTYLNLIRELMKSEYDIILTSTSWYICYPVAKVTGKKFILLTEYWNWSSDSTFKKILLLITRYIERHSDAIIATGTKSYEAYLFLGINPKTIFKCVQSAIDYSDLPTEDIKREFGSGGKKIILFIGRIVPVKGIDILIKAFALLEREIDATLLIIGDGYFRPECEDLVKKLGIKNAFFMGSVYEDKLKASYLKACDVFVLPSFNEPWGLVINEAMAFGKPIVTTKAVGAAHDLVINNHNGYVVKKNDIQELYIALKKLVSNQDLIKIMGVNSRKIFEKQNNINNMYETFEKAFNYVYCE